MNYENPQARTSETNEKEITPDSRMAALLAMPAFIAMITGCSDVVDNKVIAEAIENGSHVEYIQGKALEDLKASVPALRAKFQGKKSVRVNADNGDEIGIYFPEDNVLVIATDGYKNPEDRPTYQNPKYDGRSYTFQNDGTVLLHHGIRLQEPDGGHTSDRTVIQNHDGKYLVSYSQMNDFGSKRTYEIGSYKYNEAVAASSIEADLQKDQVLVNKALNSPQ